MFLLNSAEIDSFRNMYNRADQTPILVASDSIINISMETTTLAGFGNDVDVYPTISFDGEIHVKSKNGVGIKQIDVYSSDGKRVGQQHFAAGTPSCNISLPSAKTVYLMKIQTTEKIVYRKVIRQ